MMVRVVRWSVVTAEIIDEHRRGEDDEGNDGVTVTHYQSHLSMTLFRIFIFGYH
jgi:hypothetical protein